MIDVHCNNGLRFCDRISRRHALRVGSLATLGLGLPQLLRAASEANSALDPHEAGRSFGKAKRVILLFMWGGPAHQDIWDLKPNGPVELKGEFLPIGTNVPGIHISEHLPLIAQHADKLAIIRSVGQEDNNHSTGAHAGLTGRRHTLKAENFSASEKDFPHYGSVLSNLAPNVGGMPTFVSLPDVIGTTAGAVTPGQGGGLIGRRYDPFQITDQPDLPGFAISSLKLPWGMNDGRMQERRALLRQVDEVARVAERATNAGAMDSFYQQALDMVLSPAARSAFDLAQVSEEERWRYGWHTFGQSVLMARKLAEAGVKLVTVYWHRETTGVDASWDTHATNFPELKNRLLPSVDRPIAALLEDLDARGLLDETLVVWNSEFGRTPRINANGGRDHWGPCNSVVMAGGGIAGGQVFGASDKSAAHPISEKVTQDDIAATIYHQLGIPTETLIYDRTERPYPVALGEPITKLLGAAARAEPIPEPKPRAQPRQLGSFNHMLVERGRRFLCCDFGNPTSEIDWKLEGWSNVSGQGDQRFRRPQAKQVTLNYARNLFGMLAYELALFRLSEPRSLEGFRFWTNDVEMPISPELRKDKPRLLWRIPLPPGTFILAVRRCEMQIEAADWPLREFALLGDDRNLDLHLDRFKV